MRKEVNIDFWLDEANYEVLMNSVRVMVRASSTVRMIRKRKCVAGIRWMLFLHNFFPHVRIYLRKKCVAVLDDRMHAREFDDVGLRHCLLIYLPSSDHPNISVSRDTDRLFHRMCDIASGECHVSPSHNDVSAIGKCTANRLERLSSHDDRPSFGKLTKSFKVIWELPRNLPVLADNVILGCGDD